MGQRIQGLLALGPRQPTAQTSQGGDRGRSAARGLRADRRSPDGCPHAARPPAPSAQAHLAALLPALAVRPVLLALPVGHPVDGTGHLARAHRRGAVSRCRLLYSGDGSVRGLQQGPRGRGHPGQQVCRVMLVAGTPGESPGARAPGDGRLWGHHRPPKTARPPWQRRWAPAGRARAKTSPSPLSGRRPPAWRVPRPCARRGPRTNTPSNCPPAMCPACTGSSGPPWAKAQAKARRPHRPGHPPTGGQPSGRRSTLDGLRLVARSMVVAVIRRAATPCGPRWLRPCPCPA